MKTNDVIAKYKKEDIEDLYIVQNLSKDEVCDILHISSYALNSLLKNYEIAKSAEQLQKQRENTNLKKYGVANPSKSPEIIEKIKNVNIERYGKASYAATKEGKEKSKQTKLERYGNCNYNNQEKSKQTKLEKYGDENYNNREKLKETCQERYNVDNPFQLQKVKDINYEHNTQDYSDIFKEIYSDRDKATEYLSKGKYNYTELSSIFNAPTYTIQQWVTRNNLKEYIDYSYTGESSYEKEIREYLKSLGITDIVEHKKLKDGKEWDIYIPSLNLAIEFNGTYWHSSLFKDKDYHFDKSKEAEREGVRLIHIYEYEWNNPDTREKLKSMLRIATGKVEERIYARDCEIRKISNEEAREFNEKGHLQGHRNAQTTYGLFYKDRLVQLMSFSRTRYNRNLKNENEWEIIRGCPGSNNIVVGGVNKLFTHFVRDYNPRKVFSYCDFNKFDGRSYEAIGMKFIGYTGADMQWVLHFNDYTGVVRRSPNKHKELKEIAVAKIWGAGSKKYVYERESINDK